MTALASLPLRTIALDAELVRLAGDGNSALFLRQMLFWWRIAGNRPFYKFNAPAPEQRTYRAGDSWLEETGLTRSQFETARKRIAVKVQGKDAAQIEAAFASGALVVYWTTETHLTWYALSEANLREIAPALHERFLGDDEAAPVAAAPPPPRALPRPGPELPLRWAKSNKVAPPRPLARRLSRPNAASPHQAGLPSPPECPPPTFPDAASPHSLMQDSRIGIIGSSAEMNVQREEPEKTTQAPSLPPTARVRASQEEARSQILADLEARGVFPDAARQIAARAMRQGLGTEGLLDLFTAHLRQAEREGARHPLGVVVWRLQQQPLRPPRQTRDAGTRAEAARTFFREAAAEGGKWFAGEPLDEGGGCEGTLPEAPPPAAASAVQQLWQRVLDDLRGQMTRATFEQWLKETCLARVEGHVWIIRTPNPHAPEVLTKRLGRLIRQTLAWHVGEDVAVCFELSTPSARPEAPEGREPQQQGQERHLARPLA